MSNNQDKNIIQTMLKYVARNDVFIGCRFLAVKHLCVVSLGIAKQESCNKKWLLKIGLIAILSDFVSVLIKELINFDVFEDEKISLEEMHNKTISTKVEEDQWSCHMMVTVLGMIGETIACLIDYVIASISQISQTGSCENSKFFMVKDNGTKSCVTQHF